MGSFIHFVWLCIRDGAGATSNVNPELSPHTNIRLCNVWDPDPVGYEFFPDPDPAILTGSGFYPDPTAFRMDSYMRFSAPSD
jgi:hypothetical protein